MTKFKTGDKVICTHNRGSAGYVQGRVLTVETSNNTSSGYCYWESNDSSGVFESEIEPYELPEGTRVETVEQFDYDTENFPRGFTGTVIPDGQNTDMVSIQWDEWEGTTHGWSVDGSETARAWTLPRQKVRIIQEEPVRQAERTTLTKVDIKIEHRNQIVGQDSARKHLKIAIKEDMPVLLVGDTGTGKTSLVRDMAQEAGHTWSRFNLTGETTVDEFVGKWTLQEGNTVWQDGILLQAMRKGQWLVVDEINVALPEILFVLHSLLDDDKFVVVPQKDGEVVKPHPQFRFFGTMNPVDEYAGTKDLNKAFKSRFPMIINVDYPEHAIETEIVRQKCDLSEEKARQIVDVGVFARKLKADDKIFYTCSTRDLLQWGHLVRGGLDMQEAFELSILNKANGDAPELKKGYETVTGAYNDLHKKGHEELSIDYFNKLAHEHERAEKRLAEERAEFKTEREALIEKTREETIRRLLDDAKKPSAKKPTPKKKSTKK